MPLAQTVAPTEEPVTLQAAKDFLRVTGNDQDAQIAAYIMAGRQFAETYTNRQLCTATFALKLSGFAPKIYLPRPPLGSVTSITYLDLNAATQTLSATVYQVVNDQEGAYIIEAYNQFWPSYQVQPDAITITYTAGYGAATAVPAAIRQAILILIRGWYDDCGCTSADDMPLAVTALLGMFKVWDLEWGGPESGRISTGAAYGSQL